MGGGRWLCTTALEESWRNDVPVLFLGEWCCRYSRRERWSAMDRIVLPYHWDDRERLRADYVYALELHERLLGCLTEELNRIHGVQKSLRYWRILLGPWLGHFVQIALDRWRSIEHAIVSYELEGTVVLSGASELSVPNDMPDFIRRYVEDDWNHDFYAAILRSHTRVKCVTAERSRATSVSRPAPATSAARSLRYAVARSYAWAASLLSRDKDAFLLNTYLQPLDELRMQWRLGQVPQFREFVPAPSCPAQPACRLWRIKLDARSQFETFILAMIPQHIPTIYLEGYEQLQETIRQLPWPGSPRLIWTSNSHGSDDVFKAWAAQKTEEGVPLVIGQHGGHYGTGLWCFAEEHDIAISDRYLSWGWSDRQQPKVTAVGQLKAKRPLGVRHSAQSELLLVTATLPRYSYWMYSCPVASQWLSYFDDQCAFVGSLPAPIRAAATVRLYPTDFGWDQVMRWRERFPDLRLDDGRRSMTELTRVCRVYVSTYNATTFLESFTMNVPTVIYWNEAHWELRPDAIPAFAELKRVGIFHETAESAARHVAAIWSDPDAWWSGAEVRAVLERFKRKYCDLPEDMLGRLAQVLTDLAPGSPRT